MMTKKNSGKTTPKTSGVKTIPTAAATVSSDNDLFIERQVPANLEHHLQPDTKIL